MCHNCGGTGFIKLESWHTSDEPVRCTFCDGTGIIYAERNLYEALALIHSEVSEALEELRNGSQPDAWWYNDKDVYKPEGFPVELADIIIRVLDLAGGLDIDMATVLEQKIEYNRTRPFRHGGKRA